MDSICKKIHERNWETLKSIWINFIPTIRFPIEIIPPSTSELKGLNEVCSDVLSSGSTRSNNDYQIDGIHSGVFEESVLLFYKSLNVLRSAECILANGFKSWSIPTSYQSCYFAIRCIMNLLGVHNIRIGSKDLVIDLLPYYKNANKRKLERLRSLHEMRLLFPSKQIMHLQMWTLFQRLFRILNKEPYDSQLTSLFYRFDPKDFAKQRNRIIYTSNHWEFEDLKETIIDDSFAIRIINLVEQDNLDPNDSDFTLIINFILLRVSLALFKDIAEDVPRFKDEFTIMEDTINKDDNSHYKDFISTNSLVSF